jgi:carboxypeptidase C (cathepsin A)
VAHGILPSIPTDWLCNADGVEAVVSRLAIPQSHKFNEAKMSEYTVNGKVVGKFKTAGKFSFLEVFDAGHFVAAYQPAAALQAFSQTINQQTLHCT